MNRRVAVVAAAAFYAVWTLIHFIHAEVGWNEAGHVFLLGLYTLGRVLLLIALAAPRIDGVASPGACVTNAAS